MAGGTAGQVLCFRNFVVRRQLPSEFQLVCRLHVIHSENVFTLADVLCRIPMTIETPFHIERGMLRHQGHAIHLPVAGLTAHTLSDMNAVIEINEIRKVVDSSPGDRLACPETGPYRLQRRTLVPDHGMTIHARLGRRDVG